VYDRFHLIKNAKDQLDKYLTVSVPIRILWATQKNVQSPEVKPIEVTMTKDEKEKHAREMKKWELIQKIKAAYQSGNSILSLSKFFNLDRRTISKYVRLIAPPSSSRHRVSSIDSYYDMISLLENKNDTVKKIDATIREHGYTGPYSAVSRKVAELRKRKKLNQPPENPTQHISRKQLSIWMWKMKDMLHAEEQSKLTYCLNKYPELKKMYNTIQEYRTIIEAYDYPAFLKWMGVILNDKKHSFHHYAYRLRSDLNAIKHAFLFPYSNGLVEGQINKLKTIKRMMYGKAHLPLLQKRVVYQL
jgi:transposase